MPPIISWTSKYEMKPGRWVYVQSSEAKKLGRNINEHIRKHWKIPSYFYHLQLGGHVQALKVHIDNKHFSSLDITDFFGSVSRTRVTRELKSLIGYERARAIAKASTIPHCNPDEHSHSLPYGFSQSPLLASICLAQSHFGSCIRACHETDGMSLSVYMDDIVISSNDEQMLLLWHEKLKIAAGKSKFKLNSLKENISSTSIEVFNINITEHEMHVSDKRFSKLHTVYSLSESEHQRKGIGGYVWTVNPDQAKELDC
ncbi:MULTISPECIES: reverse transcriptase domain-containing protein [Vibrio]|uniref:Uncharacterized protein n=2 Tax=Vibrio TaxID=662 RepID=A0A2N7C937_VIBSP|nr:MULTISPECIES: reverse transcriptase domain-containing protein [Vibrio]MBT2975958.1 hypothetical protein [Vibrio anguillarum]MBT2984000.1 hypothetical protein [Vibrio anguillarum]PMF17659.1 hypothetical protein BCV19_18140 [Vibrio splendidus]PTP66351.1 hypothetical protein CWO31_11035 [Vibrio splendidus]PTP97236.1 hypothetical protein CWO28_20915 [Vibrio splendidus]